MRLKTKLMVLKLITSTSHNVVAMYVTLSVKDADDLTEFLTVKDEDACGPDNEVVNPRLSQFFKDYPKQ